jgi:predicted RNase H-like HicB family nuclease
MSNYRVLLHYDSERSVFVARAPELEHCSAEGATRAEAIAKVEEEIDAQVRNAREQGGAPPPAIDDAESAATGEIALKVSRGLHRELLFQARAEGVEVSQLAGELIAGALDGRRSRGRRPQGEAQPQRQPYGNRPPRDERGGGGRYHSIMEDRASFVEYVRGLESGAPPGRGPRGPRGDDPRRRPGGRGRSGGGQGGTGGGGPGSGPGSDDDGSDPK